ncbi:KAP family P-loop NTPase fold protein [Shinella sp.]|uniref:KAP family P-loop NTPase fold protein n=1 Tax=Shinella sp. TaxID=1870904 RepID=UPI003F71FEAD
MRFSPPEEAVVLYETAFTDDLLDRKKVGQALSDLLERIEDPLVVVLDGGWGAGKSYFLQRWVGAHTSQFGGRATTVYFDAFAHDYLEDPLVALIGALSERLPPEKKPTMDKVKSLAWKLLRPAARVGLSIATFGATEALNDAGDVLAEAIGEETKGSLDKFWQREEGRRVAMAQFREAVAALMAPIGAEQSAPSPLVIVVDELDRCRPDYALQILEIIKHFFSVPRLHFVLGVNLKALENSVKARYGAEIDATLYLQKFINITFSLPETVGGQNEDIAVVIFSRDLAKRMGIPSKITNALVEHLQLVSMSNRVSMRDICRILSSLALLPHDVFEKDYLSGWIEVMLTLVVSREIRPDLYPKFRKPSVNAKDIASYFGSSPDVIAEEGPGGEANPRYNHDAFWRHHAWLYLVQDGSLENQAILKSVQSLFFVGFSRGQPSSIPGRVIRDWLDLFTAR